MTAKIKGTVVTPDQKPVRVSVNATPVPEPATGDGSVIISGDIAVDQTSPIDVDVIPGTYRLTVYAPTRMLTACSVALKDGDTLDLASILEAAPDPADQTPGVALIDSDGKLITCANIQIVHSREEADALPDGTVYVIAASAPAPAPVPVTPDHGGTPQPPAPAPAGVQLVDHAAGQATGNTITVMLTGQTGDRAVVAVNTKAVSDQSFTWPPDWTVLVEPYWVGTQQFMIAAGPWSQTIDVNTAKPVEAGWAGFAVRGGGAPTVGTVKDRTKDPKETTTVTAPPAPGATGLTLAFGFERSAAAEARDQITVSTDWEIIDFATQDSANYQTVLLAKWSGTGAPSAMVATYPNAQATNGAGVQVVIPNA